MSLKNLIYNRFTTLNYIVNMENIPEIIQIIQVTD